MDANHRALPKAQKRTAEGARFSTFEALATTLHKPDPSPHLLGEVGSDFVRLLWCEEPSLVRRMIRVAFAKELPNSSSGAFAIVVAELGRELNGRDHIYRRHKPQHDGTIGVIIFKCHPDRRTDWKRCGSRSTAERQDGHRPGQGISAHGGDDDLKSSLERRVRIARDCSSVN